MKTGSLAFGRADRRVPHCLFVFACFLLAKDLLYGRICFFDLVFLQDFICMEAFILPGHDNGEGFLVCMTLYIEENYVSSALGVDERVFFL